MIENINLNLIPNGVSPVCHVSQYDAGREIKINLFEGANPYTIQSGDTFALNVRKTDNTVINTTDNTIIIYTAGNTYVTIKTTEQITAAVGEALCELRITNGSTVIGTLNFIMLVERDVIGDGIASDSVIEDLDALVENSAKSYVEAKVGELNNTVSNYIGVESMYTFQEKKYIATSGNIGTTVNTTPITNNAINCLITPCNARDIVFITGKGFGGARLWAFVDENNVLLDHAAATVTEDNLRIVAPFGTAKVIINVDRNQPYNFIRINYNSPVYNSILHSTNTTLNSTNYQLLGITDVNTIKGNTVYSISNSITEEMIANLPVYSQSGILITIAAHTPYNNIGVITLQLYYSVSGYYSFYRLSSAGSYYEWKTHNQATNVNISSSNYSSNLTDANNAVPYKTYAFNATITEDMVANLPVYNKTAILTSFAAFQGSSGNPSGLANLQFFVTIDSLNFYFRTKGSNWNNWHSLINNDNYNLDSYFVNTCVQKPITLDSTKRVILFGDSITTGTGSDDMSNPQYWLKYVSDMTGCQWTTYGVGSSAFVDTGKTEQRGGQIITQINNPNVNWNCDLVVVAAGTNDAGFGYDIDESELLPQLRTDVIACINAIKTNLANVNSNAKIVFITPLRRGGSTANKLLIRSLLPKVSSQIANAALMNGLSVINGFDFPITVETTAYYDRMTNYDELHPNNIGKAVYARSFLNAIL